MFLYPLHGPVFQSSGYSPVFVQTVRSRGSTNRVDTEFFIELLRFCPLASYKRVVGIITHHMMVLHINKRWMTVENRHTEVIIESPIQVVREPVPCSSPSSRPYGIQDATSPRWQWNSRNVSSHPQLWCVPYQFAKSDSGRLPPKISSRQGY